MSAVDDLVTWLRAQLDARDRRIAEFESNADMATVFAGHLISREQVRSQAAEARAEIDAKRAILDRYADAHWHAPAIPGATSPILQVEDTGACRTCVTVRLLALPYADRPGYREEWRP